MMVPACRACNDGCVDGGGGWTPLIQPCCKDSGEGVSDGHGEMSPGDMSEGREGVLRDAHALNELIWTGGGRATAQEWVVHFRFARGVTGRGSAPRKGRAGEDTLASSSRATTRGSTAQGGGDDDEGDECEEQQSESQGQAAKRTKPRFSQRPRRPWLT